MTASGRRLLTVHFCIMFPAQVWQYDQLIPQWIITDQGRMMASSGCAVCRSMCSTVPCPGPSPAPSSPLAPAARTPPPGAIRSSSAPCAGNPRPRRKSWSQPTVRGASKSSSCRHHDWELPLALPIVTAHNDPGPICHHAAI